MCKKLYPHLGVRPVASVWVTIGKIWKKALLNGESIETPIGVIELYERTQVNHVKISTLTKTPYLTGRKPKKKIGLRVKKNKLKLKSFDIEDDSKPNPPGG